MNIVVPLNIESWSGALTLLTALGIIFIGVRELFQPSIAASQFGVPLVEPRDNDFLAIKASRDIASGVVVLALFAIGDHGAVVCAMLALTLIPIFDGLVVFRHAHWVFKPAILIHWGTAVFMLLVVQLLRMGL